MLDFLGVGVGDDKDGVEDGGEVEGVDGGGEIGGDEGIGVGDVGGGLLGEGVVFYVVELEVYLLDFGDGEVGLEEEFVGYGGEGEVVEEEEVEEGVSEEDGEVDEEEDGGG